MKRAAVILCFYLIIFICFGDCQQRPTETRIQMPDTSYTHPPELPFKSTDYVFKLNQMESSYDVPGEFGHSMEGQKYGFEALSLIITETHPNGGPPLHTHEVEEAHVLIDGTVLYVIGDSTFTVEGPYVAKVPAGVPHTFINSSQEPINIVAVFPGKKITYSELGPNPLVKQ